MIRRTPMPGWDRFERLFDFRQLIEPLIARTAAERRSDDDLPPIRDMLAAYLGAGTDREASRAADQAQAEDHRDQPQFDFGEMNEIGSAGQSRNGQGGEKQRRAVVFVRIVFI